MRGIVSELLRLAQVEYHGWFIRRLDRQSRRAVWQHMRSSEEARRKQQQSIHHTAALRKLTRETSV